MNEDLQLIKELETLRSTHRNLDDRIKFDPLDDFTLQRLKKEKMRLKQRMIELEMLVYPDITA